MDQETEVRVKMVVFINQNKQKKKMNKQKKTILGNINKEQIKKKKNYLGRKKHTASHQATTGINSLTVNMQVPLYGCPSGPHPNKLNHYIGVI